jgi:hypothetical protein
MTIKTTLKQNITQTHSQMKVKTFCWNTCTSIRKKKVAVKFCADYKSRLQTTQQKMQKTKEKKKQFNESHNCKSLFQNP